MTDQLPKVGHAGTEHVGLAIVKETVMRETSAGGLGSLFRELPTLDMGLDGQIELTAWALENGLEATGRILSVQVKSGQSYFANDDGSAWTLYVKKSTVRYWRSHSVPVLLLLVDVATRVVYWVQGDAPDHQENAESFSIRVPRTQILNASALPSLRTLAENTTAEGRELARLETDLPLMLAEKRGERIVCDITHWHNKSSGRMDYHLGIEADVAPGTADHNPRDMITFTSGLMIGTGGDPLWATAQLVPWADVSVDENFLELHLEDLYGEYLNETGTYDSEEKCMIDTHGNFASWLKKRQHEDQAAPYYVDGEVSSYRLSITLNAVGSAWLTVREYASSAAGTPLPLWPSQ